MRLAISIGNPINSAKIPIPASASPDVASEVGAGVFEGSAVVKLITSGSLVGMGVGDVDCDGGGVFGAKVFTGKGVFVA